MNGCKGFGVIVTTAEFGCCVLLSALLSFFFGLPLRNTVEVRSEVLRLLSLTRMYTHTHKKKKKNRAQTNLFEKCYTEVTSVEFLFIVRKDKGKG
jgi:hypothetical protein